VGRDQGRPRALADLSRDFERRIAESSRHLSGGRQRFQYQVDQAARRCPVRELGLPGGKKGKTGAYGTDASILEELALRGVGSCPR
jgi:DNA polymerase-1